jgi:hypothetical protein
MAFFRNSSVKKAAGDIGGLTGRRWCLRGAKECISAPCRVFRVISVNVQKSGRFRVGNRSVL